MFTKIVGRMTYANVMATLAFFIAVGGGTAFAVVAANQVNSASIIDHEVRKADLAGGAVTRAKLHANAVNTNKVLDNSLSAADIKNTASGTDAVNADKLNGLTGAGYVGTAAGATKSDISGVSVAYRDVIDSPDPGPSLGFMGSATNHVRVISYCGGSDASVWIDNSTGAIINVADNLGGTSAYQTGLGGGTIFDVQVLQATSPSGFGIGQVQVEVPRNQPAAGSLQGDVLTVLISAKSAPSPTSGECHFMATAIHSEG